MSAELVFNDRSVATAPSRPAAIGWFTDMMQTVADLIDEGLCEPVIHSNLDLYTVDLIPDDYGFQEWVDDQTQDRELRQLGWTLSVQSPVGKGLLAAREDNDEFERSEYLTDDDRECLALGVALAWDGIAISLPSQEVWQQPWVAIRQHLYDADLENYAVIRHRVRNASLPAHVAGVSEDWRRCAGAGLTRADELIANWATLFPNLDLCLEFRHKTLPALDNRAVLRSVIDRLLGLDWACRDWTGEVPEYPFNAARESPITMKNDDRKKQRLATCPHLGQQPFVMHCYIQPSGYRMYWLENTQLCRMCVGYVGTHLETAKWKAQ
jgi:hypothetical protein